MTRVTHESKTVIQHRYVAPGPWPQGADYGTLVDALNMAESKAKEIGLNTDTDDWCRVFAEDDTIVVVVTEEYETEPAI